MELIKKVQKLARCVWQICLRRKACQSNPLSLFHSKHSIAFEEFRMNPVTFALQNIKNDYGKQ